MTTQVAVSNKSIEESVAAGQPLCAPRGPSHGFGNNGSEDPEVLCGITSAATEPQYFRESGEVIDAEFGGELARF